MLTLHSRAIFSFFKQQNFPIQLSEFITNEPLIRFALNKIFDKAEFFALSNDEIGLAIL